MIQIPLALAVVVVLMLHTSLTHLLKWTMKKYAGTPDINILLLLSYIEITLTIALICTMKQV
jgi:hypothetical protein